MDEPVVGGTPPAGIIKQGLLEQLSYKERSWKEYFGDIDEGSAVLMPAPEGSSQYKKEIHFNSEFSATISIECLTLCSSESLQDKDLTKVY